MGVIVTSEDGSETISWAGISSRHCHSLGMVLVPSAGLALCTHGRSMVLFVLGERIYMGSVLPT